MTRQFKDSDTSKHAILHLWLQIEGHTFDPDADYMGLSAHQEKRASTSFSVQAQLDILNDAFILSYELTIIKWYETLIAVGNVLIRYRRCLHRA